MSTLEPSSFKMHVISHVNSFKRTLNLRSNNSVTNIINKYTHNNLND